MWLREINQFDPVSQRIFHSSRGEKVKESKSKSNYHPTGKSIQIYLQIVQFMSRKRHRIPVIY